MSRTQDRVTASHSPGLAQSSGDDSAGRQLLEELEASPTKALQSSAIRSASLLNAARVDRRTTLPRVPSSPPTGTTRTLAFSSPRGVRQSIVKDGRLERLGFQSADLAKSAMQRKGMRADVYDVPSASPQKGPFRLPERVNHKPMKVIKKPKKQTVPFLESSPPQLPNGTTLDQAHGLQHPAQPKTTPRSKRKADPPEDGSGILRKSQRREDVGREGLEDAAGPRRTRSQATIDHPQVVIASKQHHKTKKTPRTRLSREAPVVVLNNDLNQESEEPEEEQDLPTTAGHQRHMSDGNVASPIAKKRDRKRKDIDSRPEHAVEKPLPPSEATRATMKLKRVKTRPRDRQPSPLFEPEIDVFDNMQPIEDIDVDEEANEVDADYSDEGDYTNDEMHNDPSPISVLTRVFKFIDSGQREGTCQTREGRRIMRACNEACELISEYDQSEQEVQETLENMRSTLSTVHRQNAFEDQKGVKVDAFAYLLPALCRLLETVYGWAVQQYGDPLIFLSPLHILLRLIQDLLKFKDAIAHWKVQVPQRSKGDRIVKDVEQRLIGPLRKVERQLRREVTRLTQAEHALKAKKESEARRRQLEEEEKQKEEKVQQLIKRRKRWQNLHHIRLECEPSIDNRRRKHLFYRKIEDIIELDANGVPFEREAVFRDRQTPFAHRASPFEEREWTNEQEAALIDGLQEYAGKGVFENIFRTYCRPGGLLRDFNVSEITAQALYLRTVIVDRWQSDAPDWAKKIPVLP